jgi:D-alanyl-D-alanine carboxypeptidase (penicillin-binding protein 5/6)
MQALVTDSSIAKTAKGAFLYDMATETVLYAKNPDQKLYPASLTKVMTALVALEHIDDLDEMVTVSVSAVADMDPEATLANLVPGEEMSMENLLYCLMVESANDAGAVIAEYVAGSHDAFAEMMNRKAAELGCTGTHFTNAHGLHDEEHYTTARDMAKIMMAALEHSTFVDIYSTPRYVVPETNLRGERILNSTNYLIANDIIDFYYEPLITGGKTGYTSAAGRCLVSTAESEESDMKLVCVILGAEEYINEDGNIEYYGSFEETVDVVKYGLYKFTTAELYHRGQVVGQFDVAGGENSVVGEPADSRRVLVRNDFKESDITFRTEVLNGGLNAPIAVGDKIGILRVWYKNVCIAQTDILSLSVSKKDTMNSIFDGGVITDEESDKITSSFNVGLKIFIGLVAVVVVLSVGVAVYNAVIEHKRRKRRRNRRRSR